MLIHLIIIMYIIYAETNNISKQIQTDQYILEILCTHSKIGFFERTGIIILFFKLTIVFNRTNHLF